MLCSLVTAREQIECRNSVMLSLMYRHRDSSEFGVYKFVNCGHVLELQRWPCVVSQSLCTIGTVFESSILFDALLKASWAMCPNI
jgi:hypothetical protein